ncbi:MAG TPA: universal stress protein [Edaphobacter sp.]
MHDKRDSIVVGIDGSIAAIRAACWAVREVAGTGTPLRLVHCSDLYPEASQDTRSRTRTVVEKSIHDTCAAIDALGQSVKVEVEVVDDHPLGALVDASRSARMLCIGNAESGNQSSSGFGSTAAELAASAHCCVAVVRGEHHTELLDSRDIVAVVDGSAQDDAVLRWGFEEASRRNAALVLLTAYRTGFDLLQQDSVLLDHDHRMQAVLNGYADARGPRYPHVPLRTVTASSTFVGYLAEHAATTQLAVISADKTSELFQIFGAGGAVALKHTDFSLLVTR